MKPQFEFGQEVRVTRNIRNDGTFPGRDIGELLLRRGATGYVRDIGRFLQDEIIYAIDFIEYGYRVGCREQELLCASAPWVQNRYEFRDRVRLNRILRVGKELVARAGDEGEIARVMHDGSAQISYHVYIAGRTFLVPEMYLDGESLFDERVSRTIERGVDTEGQTKGATLPWQSL